MMRRSNQPSIMLWACLATLFVLAHARPSSNEDTKESDAQNLQTLKDDMTWEAQWWTPEEKGPKDSKDSWKVFKTQKPAERRRWWEEDWHEDEWWAPKDSSNSVSNSKTVSLSTKKTSVPSVEKGKGEDATNSVSKVDSPATMAPKDVQPQEVAEEPKALPLVSAPEGEDQSGFILKDNSVSQNHDVDQKINIPIAETPKEKLNPGMKGDIMISPFEDPKPMAYSQARDDAPIPKQWQYHQLTGFGKYIDHNKDNESDDKETEEKEEPEEASEEKEVKNESEEMEEAEYLKEKAEHMDEEMEKKEEDRVVQVPEESKYKVVDQFYGFGLESGSGAPASTASASLESNKESEDMMTPTETAEPKESADAEPEKKNKETYNKGIIYDVIPGAPELTHSVKKDLVHSGNKDVAQSLKPNTTVAVQKEAHASVKKDLSKEYSEDIVSTKANLQTSPNPPPPDLAESDDSETTSMAPSKSPAKSEPAKMFIKSHPLTFCKLDEECRKGRMCRNGMCVCLPSDGCQGHYKPVCGSDGVQYPSFCELHRTACVKHVHIKVDYTAKCFMKHANEMLKIQKENYKDHLVPQSSHDSEEEEDSEDVDDGDYEDGDYDEDDYTYDEDEDVDVKEGGKEGDEVDAWLKSNTKKITLDSGKIYDYSKDLKKAAAKKTNDDNNKVDTSPWDHVQEETGQEYSAKEKSKVSAWDGKGVGAAGQQVGSNNNDDVYDGYQSDGGYKECTKAELDKFKHQLLVFHCNRFQEPDCKLEVKEERDYLTNLMFSYLDMNTDYQLSYEELESRQKSEQFGDLNNICELTDLIWYDDKLDADGRLSLDEFEEAFNYLGSKEKSQKAKPAGKPLAPVVHIIPTLATVGNGLELKCGLVDTGAGMVWRRQGVNIRDLANATGELMVLDDGSLFFSKMGVHHMGNYSCEDSSDSSTVQIHSLKVQMPPIVKVTPHSQIHLPMLNAKMKCHAEGVPKPTIMWQKNNMPIGKEAHHYAIEDHDELLLVFDTNSQRDSGAYKCVAKNQAGTSEDVASVVIMKDDKSWQMDNTHPNSGKFMVFHKDGYTVYDPDVCLKPRTVHKDFGFFKFIPDNLDGPLQLCRDGRDCSWGQVVNVKNSFVYASQPEMNRVVVIETTKNWIPMQVVSTDRQPMQLHYVEHLDQVWVLCWNGGADDSSKTIVVIRDASKIVQHRSVHTQPVGNHFDQIQNLFIAPSNDLRHTFDYGYVTHNGQQGLTKLDLDNMRYVKAVDLTAYGCVPRSLAFVPIGGHVVVECVSPRNHQTLQLVMDYITDAVVSSAVLSGHPYVSPDSRHVVTVDDLTGKVSVAGVNNEGLLEAAYEVTVSASISDVAFYPAFGEGYLLILTSSDDDDIITINLSTGKVAKLKGTNGGTTTADWHPSPVRRTITTGDIFCDFLMAPSKSSLAIMDMKFHHVACENTDIPRSQAAIFVGH